MPVHYFILPLNLFKKIDWKIKLCAGLILGAAGLLIYQTSQRRSFSSNTFQNAKLIFTEKRYRSMISFLQCTTGEKYKGPWTPETTEKYRPQMVTWNFIDVLSQTLRILDENDSNLPQITLTSTNEKHQKIFEFLDFGVDGKYEDKTDNQHKSWVNKILGRLKNQNYIADFTISKDRIVIDKIVK